MRELHAGRIPAWLQDTIAFRCRTNPSPSDTQDDFERSKLERARRYVAELEAELQALKDEHRRALAYGLRNP